MLVNKILVSLFIVSLLFINIGCSLHPKIKAEDAYVRIKPIAPLPEIENELMPNNLEILVENVADMSGSYKNRLELYVNKYIIEPDEVFNYKSTYKYNLKLQPGQYQVKAKYYANSGWVEQSFTITTREDVKVYLNKKTVLSIKLEKNHWGGLNDDMSYFKVQLEPLESK